MPTAMLPGWRAALDPVGTTCTVLTRLPSCCALRRPSAHSLLLRVDATAHAHWHSCRAPHPPSRVTACQVLCKVLRSHFRCSIIYHWNSADSYIVSDILQAVAQEPAEPGPTEKRCERCTHVLQLRFFPKMASQPDGTRSLCRGCMHELRLEAKPPGR